MDEQYYERVLTKVIRDGPYEELEHDPLYGMIGEVNDVLEKHKHVVVEEVGNQQRS